MIPLMRRYVYGFVNSHDFTVPRSIMTDGYTLHMGSDTLVGRDDVYLPAVQHQFSQFPLLGYAIHELITDGTQMAVRFSEHGRALREPGHAAAWAGVAIYRTSSTGDRLAECWVEQDHYGRRSQLASGTADSLAPVAIDPWDGHDEATPAAAPAVDEWAASLSSWPPPGAEIDPGQASAHQPRIDVDSVTINAVVAEGDRVSFNATIRGTYQGGLDGFDDRIGIPIETHAGVFADVRDGLLAGIRGVSNRVAVQRQLKVELIPNPTA